MIPKQILFNCYLWKRYEDENGETMPEPLFTFNEHYLETLKIFEKMVLKARMSKEIGKNLDQKHVKCTICLLDVDIEEYIKLKFTFFINCGDTRTLKHEYVKLSEIVNTWIEPEHYGTGSIFVGDVSSLIIRSIKLPGYPVYQAYKKKDETFFEFSKFVKGCQ